MSTLTAAAVACWSDPIWLATWLVRKNLLVLDAVDGTQTRLLPPTVNREPVHVEFLGYDVYGMPMPSSGGATVGMILNLLEAAMGDGTFTRLPKVDAATAAAEGGQSSSSGVGFTGLAENEAEYYGDARDDVEWAQPGLQYGTADLAALADAQNIAFADRNKYMADADFEEVPMAPMLPPEVGQGLLDKQYAARRWAEFGGDTTEPVPYGTPPGFDFKTGAGYLEDDHGTTHFVVVDKVSPCAHWSG